MQTLAANAPASLPFSAWQALPAASAAHEVHSRLAALPAQVRAAALAWLRPEAELRADISAAKIAGQPLAGLPFLVKDLFDLAGVPTKAGSTFLERVRPPPTLDSRMVRRFAALGAACAGKTHLVEFASGLTGENPHYGDCPHPQFPDRLSGGSSSGSAALGRAGVVPLAIGTDTGGSIRVPAAFCGLFGFRMTPGQEWITDAFPLAPTMDTAGWFTAHAADMLTAWRALVNDGASKSGTWSPPRGCYLPMNGLLRDIDPAFARACDAAAARHCPPADAQTEAMLLDSWQDAVDAYQTIGLSEAHAIHSAWLTSHREDYDPVIWQRFHDAGQYSAEQQSRARAKLQEVRDTWRRYFMDFEFLILPASPGVSPRKVDCTAQLRRRIIQLTAPASLGGLPVLSVPVPLTSGLSAGLQIILPSATSDVVPWILHR